MNDHSLDDLIIDNIDPKTGKSKSFLTIIALAIIILIVAIILTKVVLRESEEKLVLDENDTEFISPELTLQPSISQNETPNTQKEIIDSLKLESTAAHTLSKPVSSVAKESSEPTGLKENKPETDTEKKEFITQTGSSTEDNRKKTTKKEIVKPETHPTKKSQQSHARPNTTDKKRTQHSHLYYIQVGSFTHTPSKEFLSIIKKSGFSYTISAQNPNGSKKLLIGPYSSRAQVDAALVRVRDRINKSAFVVKK